MTTCKKCVKAEKLIGDISNENYRLNMLVNNLNSDLTDKIELLEEIKSELFRAYVNKKERSSALHILFAKLKIT